MAAYGDYAYDIQQDQQIRDAIAQAEEAAAQVAALANTPGGAVGGPGVAVTQINAGPGVTVTLLAPGVYQIEVSGVVSLVEGTGIDLSGSGTITVKVDIAISTPLSDPGTITTPPSLSAFTVSNPPTQAEVQAIAAEVVNNRTLLRQVLGALTN